MRYVPPALKTRLESAQQTLYRNADPRAVVWISRPHTVMDTAQFLERQTALTGTAITSVSAAARRTRSGRAADRIYLGYVDSGAAHVVYAAAVPTMSAHVWINTGFAETASDVALAFDGTMPKSPRGTVEFLTESAPWVFWVNAGALYGRKLGGETVTLATENCTKVSAVRAMWSAVGGFDFGLCVFFILSGAIYYRQLIGGAWTDAAQVSFGPAGVTWTALAASRTWDYRVILQAVGSDGKLYELITQYAGIGKQNTEHLSIRDVTAEAGYIPVSYHDTLDAEHLSIAGITAAAQMIWGLTSSPVRAANADDGTGDWGKTVTVTLDHPVTGTAGNAGAFVLTDAASGSWTAQTISASADGLTLTLGFIDFNAASGNLTLAYAPGTIQSPAVAMSAWSIAFTPTGLVPPQVGPPEIVEVSNV